MCDNILFFHAILGCDTTSRIHGIGKALKMTESSAYFRQQSAIFNSSTSTPVEVVDAGEEILVALYRGKPE